MPEEGQQLKRFGTFSGVFLPNVLTIVGVIFFLRAGWAVGNTGLVGGMLLVVLANAISLASSRSSKCLGCTLLRARIMLLLR